MAAPPPNRALRSPTPTPALTPTPSTSHRSKHASTSSRPRRMSRASTAPSTAAAESHTSDSGMQYASSSTSTLTPSTRHPAPAAPSRRRSEASGRVYTSHENDRGVPSTSSSTRHAAAPASSPRQRSEVHASQSDLGTRRTSVSRGSRVSGAAESYEASIPGIHHRTSSSRSGTRHVSSAAAPSAQRSDTPGAHAVSRDHGKSRASRSASIEPAAPEMRRLASSPTDHQHVARTAPPPPSSQQRPETPRSDVSHRAHTSRSRSKRQPTAVPAVPAESSTRRVTAADMYPYALATPVLSPISIVSHAELTPFREPLAMNMPVTPVSSASPIVPMTLVQHEPDRVVEGFERHGSPSGSSDTIYASLPPSPSAQPIQDDTITPAPDNDVQSSETLYASLPPSSDSVPSHDDVIDPVIEAQLSETVHAPIPLSSNSVFLQDDRARSPVDAQAPPAMAPPQPEETTLVQRFRALMDTLPFPQAPSTSTSTLPVPVPPPAAEATTSAPRPPMKDVINTFTSFFNQTLPDRTSSTSTTHPPPSAPANAACPPSPPCIPAAADLPEPVPASDFEPDPGTTITTTTTTGAHVAHVTPDPPKNAPNAFAAFFKSRSSPIPPQPPRRASRDGMWSILEALGVPKPSTAAPAPTTETPTPDSHAHANAAEGEETREGGVTEHTRLRFPQPRELPPDIASVDYEYDVDEDAMSTMMYSPLLPTRDSIIELAESEMVPVYYPEEGDGMLRQGDVEGEASDRVGYGWEAGNADMGADVGVGGSSGGRNTDEGTLAYGFEGKGKARAATSLQGGPESSHLRDGNEPPDNHPIPASHYQAEGNNEEIGNDDANTPHNPTSSTNRRASSPTERRPRQKRIWVPSRTQLSFQTFWWGYRIYLPPPVLEQLSSRHHLSSHRAATLTAALTYLFTNLPIAALPLAVRPALLAMQALVPYLGYMGAAVSWGWAVVAGFDTGHGVILSATWVLPILLIPGTWPAPPPTLPPSTATVQLPVGATHTSFPAGMLPTPPTSPLDVSRTLDGRAGGGTGAVGAAGEREVVNGNKDGIVLEEEGDSNGKNEGGNIQRNEGETLASAFESASRHLRQRTYFRMS